MTAWEPHAAQKILSGYPNIKKSARRNIWILFCATLVGWVFSYFSFSVVPLGGVAAVLVVCTALLKVTGRTGIGKIQVSMKSCLQRPV